VNGSKARFGVEGCRRDIGYGLAIVYFFSLPFGFRDSEETLDSLV